MRHLPAKLPALLAALLCSASPTAAQPVLDYVSAPDESFAWEVTGEQVFGGVRMTMLSVTSQTWQGVQWTHRVRVAVPERAAHHETALLMIVGGSPDGGAELLAIASIARLISAPVVILGDIPNQPLFGGLREDALIAHTFIRLLETGDSTWPLLYPMTKAAVRTMDAVQEFSRGAWPNPVSRWVVTGASKRGWTTWFTGIAEPDRVVCIAPLVYDNLDLPSQMRNQLATWGGYSPQIRDYTVHGLPDMLATEEGRRLGEMVDPFALRHLAAMPKLIINGTNDPYWPLDAANIYWDALPGEKHLLYVPNAGHGIEQAAPVIAAEAAFFMACSGRGTLPDLQWSFEETDSVLRLHIEPGAALPVLRVNQWTAHSPSRDFRRAVWERGEMNREDGRFTASITAPGQGYTAVLGEVVFSTDGREFPLTTNVRIIGPGTGAGGPNDRD